MPKQFSRLDRAAQVIQRELARILQQEAKDPRLPTFISVSAVKVTKDFRHAKVYVTGFVEGEDKDLMLDVLNKMSGYLRTTLSKVVLLRVTPELHFVYDESVAYANQLKQKIDAAIAKDEGTEEPSS